MALKGEDTGMREYKVAKMELLPQTENIFLVYKEGWHNPESSPQNPSLERTWTKKDALVSFKNPKKDIVVYLEADTNAKAFDAPPVLTVAVGGKTGVTVPSTNSEVFLKKIRVKAADLGTEEWVDLRLAMNQSFVPKLQGRSTEDDRELGLLVYHLYVGEADARASRGGRGRCRTRSRCQRPRTAAAPAKPARRQPAKPAGQELLARRQRAATSGTKDTKERHCVRMCVLSCLCGLRRAAVAGSQPLPRISRSSAKDQPLQPAVADQADA